MALDPTIISGIEFDLRQYKKWKARLKELDDILQDVSYGSRSIEGLGGLGNQISDPTFKETQFRSKLHHEKSWLTRRVQRVENALQAMTEQQKELIKMRYFEDMPRNSVESEMGIEKSTFYRIREEALTCYAEVAGIIPLASGQG